MMYNSAKFYPVNRMFFLEAFMSKASSNLKSVLGRAVIWRMRWLQSLVFEVLLSVVFCKGNT